MQRIVLDYPLASLMWLLLHTCKYSVSRMREQIAVQMCNAAVVGLLEGSGGLPTENDLLRRLPSIATLRRWLYAPRAVWVPESGVYTEARLSDESTTLSID